MKSFYCDRCNQPIYFENTRCLACGHALAYLPDQGVMSAFEPETDGLWRALAPQANGQRYRMCQNYSAEQVCNWMVPEADKQAFCLSCRLNQTIPDLSQPENQTRWQQLELNKRRLLYTLFALGLPIVGKQDDPEHGLAFAFLADPEPGPETGAQVLTGHAQGLITINVAEADDALREKIRLDLDERYRTVLGHFRHEIGHYYWERLVNNDRWLEPYRALFGDEQVDYDQALRHYHAQGPASDWPQYHISVYASAHPWEDWAETWAHYLHMSDTLETARAVGLSIDQAIGADTRYAAFDDLIKSWFPLTFVVNSINRSMGLNDLYPFVLSDTVIEKLRFVHRVIHGVNWPLEKTNKENSNEL